MIDSIHNFIEYQKSLSGDEKGEAQVFCDRLFIAFGHKGYKEAGAVLEYRAKKKGEPTLFPDLVWPGRLLLEMKKRGEELKKHYKRTFEHWIRIVPNRPRYVVLCNFDEFWIYDFDLQIDEPVDIVLITELPERYTALSFLFPKFKEPQFHNNLVAVTTSAASKVASVFLSMTKRGIGREQAQRYALQCVVAMFAEDIKLLPLGLFSELIDKCRKGASTYDVIGGLFKQMNTEKPAAAGMYKDVPYFNGGIFETIEPVELNDYELDLLTIAAQENWAKV